MNYDKNDRLVNKVTGEAIIIDNDSTHGVFYRVVGNDQLRFATYAALEDYENKKVNEKRFMDKFMKGYYEKCELLKNTPPAKWGEVIGDVGGTLKSIVLDLEKNINTMDTLMNKFKTE